MKEFLVVFFSSFKFALTFPFAIYNFHLNFFETLVYTNLGGATGVYFFSCLSEVIIKLWKKLLHNTMAGNELMKRLFSVNKKKRIFTKRNKRIVHIKRDYGFWGVVILTPVLLSIPIGSFLVTRYYKNVRFKLVYLVMGVFVWSLVYTGFYFYHRSSQE